MEDSQQNAEGNKGDEGNQGGGSEQLNAIASKLADIETKLDSGSEISSEDQKIIEALLAGDKEGEGSSKGSNKDSVPNVDVNTLSNAQLVDYVVKAVTSSLESKFDSMQSRIDESDKRSVKLQIDKEIQFARNKYGKDFEEHWDDTIVVADKHPQLTAEECFLIATGKKNFTELNEKNKKEKAAADRKKAILGASTSGSVDSEALLDGLKGKTHRAVAKELAQRLGI